ncbi:caspase-7-like isoform X1 [Wyeomyia smithii]|uniref:caspase-7-like isoform X1 n=1 Tax=Wyeomyia smithii TaxID=174621 RepID=UPI002467E088|nr:caspase-7-like isoform X1 [Wyeomyia smithii]
MERNNIFRASSSSYSESEHSTVTKIIKNGTWSSGTTSKISSSSSSTHKAISSINFTSGVSTTNRVSFGVSPATQKGVEPRPSGFLSKTTPKLDTVRPIAFSLSSTSNQPKFNEPKLDRQTNNVMSRPPLIFPDSYNPVYGRLKPETLLNSGLRPSLDKTQPSGYQPTYSTNRNTNIVQPNSVQPSVSRDPVCSTPKRYDLSKGKGYVLIFNHKDFQDKKDVRDGSEKDLELLKNFFKLYQVETPDTCMNYSVNKVKKKMAEIEKKNFSKSSCLIVIIMSHGDRGEVIKGFDGNTYHIEADIVDRVLNNNTLKDKPKLFFIQACKGNAHMEMDYIVSAPNKHDIMKCYSTYEGTVSYRDKQAGTYFIQNLFKLIQENDDKNLQQLMVLLRNKFQNDRIAQTPTDTSTLNKDFYFGDMRKK